MSVYTEEGDDKKGNVLSQSLEKGMELKLKELKSEQHFTQPPAHYTEASLEDYGGAGNRTPEHSMPYDHNDHQQKICIQGTEESL